MAAVTPEQAVRHPNWSMGAKISVDSATLMNKGLELIEAHILFGLPPEKLDVIVHAQSVVHCLVAYADGSVLAHLSAPDMKTPIAHALGWPRRIASPARNLDLAELAQMTFEKPDFARFPCLHLARTCLQCRRRCAYHPECRQRGGGREFPGTPDRVSRNCPDCGANAERIRTGSNGRAPATLEDVLALDAAARARAREFTGQAAGRAA